MKKIIILTTGGTIFSVESKDGLVPESFNKIKDYIDLRNLDCEIIYKELMVLDSSNIQPEEWIIISNEVDKVINEFDAIIITHGTDTLAYTASMLSFMIQCPKIPIILTGSQTPLSNPLTDANDNLKLAITMAKTGIRGVFVSFDRKIILGCRAVKVRTTNFNAFESINMRNLAVLSAKGIEIDYDVVPKFNGEYQLINKINAKVFLIKLTPATNPIIIDILIESGIKGIVIEAFGAGGLQFIRRDFIAKIKNATKNNIPIIVCSQCLYEMSNFSIYEVGKKTLNEGVIEAFDMTTEATVTKLMWALGQTDNLDTIRQIFNTNYTGEIILVNKNDIC